MNPQKQQRKMRGSVLAYLTNKGIDSSLNPSLTFEQLDALQDYCEPLALETEQARTAALARLAVLKGPKLPKTPKPGNALEQRASEILDAEEAAAVRGYAKKRGTPYLHWLVHKLMHPRGKGKTELAEAWLKKAEAEIALNGYDEDQAFETRRQALSMAAACLA